jgi:hypothetical protein
MATLNTLRSSVLDFLLVLGVWLGIIHPTYKKVHAPPPNGEKHHPLELVWGTAGDALSSNSTILERFNFTSSHASCENCKTGMKHGIRWRAVSYEQPQQNM